MILNKMKPMRTKTLVTDDNYSDHSSDLDFATNHREYNKMQKIDPRIAESISENFLSRLTNSKKKEFNLNTLGSDEDRRNVKWAGFNNMGTVGVSPVNRNFSQSITGKTKKKFRMGSLVEQLHQRKGRYCAPSSTKNSLAIGTNLPNLNGVSLGGKVMNKAILISSFRNSLRASKESLK